MKRQKNTSTEERGKRKAWKRVKHFLNKKGCPTHDMKPYVEEIFRGLQMGDVRAACLACGNDTSLFLPKPETKRRDGACSSTTNDRSYLQRQLNLISYNLAVAIVSFWILATLLCTVPVWRLSRLSEIVYTAQDPRGLTRAPVTANSETCSAPGVAQQNSWQNSQHVIQITKHLFETTTISSWHICPNAKKKN